MDKIAELVHLLGLLNNAAIKIKNNAVIDNNAYSEFERLLEREERKLVDMEENQEQLNKLYNQVYSQPPEIIEQIESNPEILEKLQRIPQQGKDIKALREQIEAARAAYAHDMETVAPLMALLAEWDPEENSAISELAEILETYPNMDDVPDEIENDILSAIGTIIDKINKNPMFPEAPLENIFVEADLKQTVYNLLSCVERATNTDLIDKKRNKVHKQLFPTAQLTSDMKKSGAITSPAVVEPFEVLLTSKTAKKQYKGYALLSINDDPNIEIKDRCTPWDMIVLSAVFSEVEAGNAVFSTDDIVRGAYGKVEETYNGNNQRELVDSALYKLSSINAHINFTEELKMHNFKYKDENGEKIKRMELEGRVLPLSVVKLETEGGNKRRIYRLDSSPIIYQYLKTVKKITTIKRSTLDIKEVLPNGKLGERIPLAAKRGLPIRDALALRVGIMLREIDKANRASSRKKGDKLTPLEMWQKETKMTCPYRILFSTIAEDSEVPFPDGNTSSNKKARSDFRNTCELILEYWKQTGFIGGWETVKKGRAIVGVDILFNGINC